MNDPIYNLAQIFKKLPGIGERQAFRITYDILSKDASFAESLIDQLKKIRATTALCPQCFRYYINDNILICDICSNPKTLKNTLLIVERDTDLTAIVRTGIYKGLYFVLGGSVPILEKEPEKKVRLKELFKRVEDLVSSNSLNNSVKLEEIIIGTSITPAGEHTDQIIRTYLKNLLSQNNIQIKSLGRGISTGTEIEYIDPETFSGALKNRS